MTEPIDGWLADDSPGSAAHLHAVGAFAIFYNDLELSLYGLFRLFIPNNHGVRNVLFGTLHNLDALTISLLASRHQGSGP